MAQSSSKSASKSPLVDVNIITCNNMPSWPEVLERVLQQSYSHMRINVIDDHSTDGTWEHACEVAAQDERVRVHRNSVNVGMVPNYQRAYWFGEADYVLLKSADDWVEPTYLEAIMDKMLANPKLGQCCTLGEEVNADGSVETRHAPDRFMRTDVDDIMAAATQVMQTYSIAPPFWGVYRRDVLDHCLEIGYYAGSDHVFFCEASLYGSIDFVEEYLFKRMGGSKVVGENAKRLSPYQGRGIELETKFADLEHFIPRTNLLYHHYDMFTKARIDDKYRVPLINAAEQVFGYRYGSALINEAKSMINAAEQIVAQVAQDRAPTNILLNRLYLERLLKTLNKIAMVIGNNVDMLPIRQKVMQTLQGF